MRTPYDVFEDMCPVHDQIWMFDGQRWRCIRKSTKGERYTEPSGVVPLPVEEMAAITGLVWVYFCTITGHTEPLISKEQRASLVASRTAEQIEHEKLRLAAMDKEREQHVECFLDHMFATHPGVVAQSEPPYQRKTDGELN
jgi:hypothetical protein